MRLGMNMCKSDLFWHITTVMCSRYGSQRWQRNAINQTYAPNIAKSFDNGEVLSIGETFGIN